MNKSLQAALAVAALAAAGHAAAQITLYEGEGFRGRSITVNDRVGNLDRAGFNDRASSVIVDRGRWEVCDRPRFEGRCVVLRRGSYPSLRELGLNNQLSSIRPADNRRRYEELPPPVATIEPAYEWRRRPNEVVYEVPVSSVRAVVGPPNQRCWVERQQVTEAVPRNDPNPAGLLIGGVVGGILGHQIGGGTGKDLATAPSWARTSRTRTPAARAWSTATCSAARTCPTRRPRTTTSPTSIAGSSITCR